MKIVHITDLHIAPVGRVPASRVESEYHKTVWEELDTLRSDIERESPDVICVTGDIFHYKSPTAYHPCDISKVSEYFDSFRVPVLAIPGNHDLPASSVDRVRESPFWLLGKSTRNLTIFNYDYTDRPMISFRSFDRTVRVWGIPYLPIDDTVSALRKLNTSITALKEKTSVDVVMIHSDFIPDANVNVFFKVYSQYSLPYICPSGDIFLQGHIHLSFPPLMIGNLFSVPIESLPPAEGFNSLGQYMVSKPWSVGRVVKDYFNTTDVLLHQHVPSYAVVTESSVEYKTLSKFRPSSEIFQTDSLRKDVESSGMVSSFVEGLEKRFGSSEKAMEIQTPEDMLTAMPEDVRKTIQEYLEKAEKANE